MRVFLFGGGQYTITCHDNNRGHETYIYIALKDIL